MGDANTSEKPIATASIPDSVGFLQLSGFLIIASGVGWAIFLWPDSSNEGKDEWFFALAIGLLVSLSSAAFFGFAKVVELLARIEWSLRPPAPDSSPEVSSPKEGSEGDV